MTLIGFVADDFTGATDSLWQFHRHGLSTRLFTDPAEVEKADLTGVDVVGIATTARAAPTADGLAIVARALDALAAQSARVVQYKVCSTFDSSAAVGSIGAVIDMVLASGAYRPSIPVMPAQPEFGRYTVFGNHFAAFQGEVVRLDRHPVMSRHPVTPSREADLRLHLADQTDEPVGLLSPPALASDDLRAPYDELAGRWRAFVIDALTQHELNRVGELLLRDDESTALPQFVVGSGGISAGLAAAATRSGAAGYGTLDPTGPVLVASGSQSSISAGQIAYAERAGWLALDLRAHTAVDLHDRVEEALRAGRDVIVYTSRGVENGDSAPHDLSSRLAAVVRHAVQSAGITRAIVVGGDTSGQVAQALGAQALELHTAFTFGSPMCRVVSSDPVIDGLELVLKGGQVGAEDHFLIATGR